MLMEALPVSLIIAYSLWYYFLGHQMSHVLYASQGHGTTPSYLPLYTALARFLGIAFLIFFGYISHWYFALILYVIGFIGQFILVRVEIALGLQKQAWAISIAGVPILPAVLVYMIYVTENSRVL